MTSLTVNPTTLACLASNPNGLGAADLSDALLQASVVLAEAQRLEAIVGEQVLDIPRAIEALNKLDREKSAFPMLWATLHDGLNAIMTLRGQLLAENAAAAQAPEPSTPRLVTTPPAQHRPLAGDRFRKDPDAYLPGASASAVEAFPWGSAWNGFVDLDGQTIPWASIEILRADQSDINAFAEAMVVSRAERCIVVAEVFEHGIALPPGMTLVTLPAADEAGPSVA